MERFSCPLGWRTKANTRAPKPRVASAKGKAGKKGHAGQEGPQSAQRHQTGEAGGKRPRGQQTTKILDLLKRPGGATAKEFMKATGWQPHSVRGFLSGTVGKKMVLAVLSTKREDGERTYSVKG